MIPASSEPPSANPSRQVDARGTRGTQIGDGNTQVNNFYVGTGQQIASPADPPATLTGPQTDGWVAAVYLTEFDRKPLGSALVIDPRRLLTCAHVVMNPDGEPHSSLSVSFKAVPNDRRLVARIDLAPDFADSDLAILELSAEIPRAAEMAPLRFPPPSALRNSRWWAFGFPDKDGNDAEGLIGATLANDLVRLDANSRYTIQPGFSGTGLWSPDYQAVVGLVGQAHGNSDGRAITMLHASTSLPHQNLQALEASPAISAGEAALAAWGWKLTDDPEGKRHWQPRGRGVAVESERGYRFRGRTKALTEIKDRLDRTSPDRQVLVITGTPGVGKSAVLGRMITTSDPDLRALLPADDDAIKATPGSVACALHAKGKTAVDVAKEIARAASARIPETLADLPAGIRDALQERNRGKFNVIIDALDEAASPAEARAIITKILLPLAQTCSDLGVDVIVGTRQSASDGPLLAPLAQASLIDLDDPRYFQLDDLAGYALACLQLAGDEREGNPYNDLAAAKPIADRIADLASRNFLVAGLVARDHGLHDTHPAEARDLVFSTTVESAFTEYLERVGPVDDLSAIDALTALGFAQSPGLPVALWQLAIESLYGQAVSASNLTMFAKTTAASYVLESNGEASATRTFRLFHQALNDVLTSKRAQIFRHADDEVALTRAFLDCGHQLGWGKAPEYLLRSLPGHAVDAGLIDDLLTDNSYLLYADLPRLILAANAAATDAGKLSTRLIGLTPQARTADSSERAGMLSVTQALEGMPITFADSPSYVARWANSQPRAGLSVLAGHQSGVHAICPVVVGDRQLLATTSDRTVRIWDPATSQQTTVLQGHEDWVRAVCPIIVHGCQYLATGGNDGTVRIWDPATSQQSAILQGHRGAVNAVCPISANGRRLLATGGNDGTFQIWDPATSQQIAILIGHEDWVNAVCPITLRGHQLLVTGGNDGTVRIWDPATKQQTAVLQGHQGAVNAVCPVTVNGCQLLATGGDDGTVRIWDPATSQQSAVIQGHQGGIRAVCPVTIHGGHLLATGGNDHTVRIWDPATSQQTAIYRGHQEWVNTVCAVTVGERHLLATGGNDHTVQIWDPATSQQTAVLQGQKVHQGAVYAVCPVTVNGRRLLAGGSGSGDRTVWIWESDINQQIAVLDGHQGAVYAVCPVTIGDRQFLATGGGNDGAVRIWDPATSQQTAILQGHQDGVNAVCPVTVGYRQLLATASDDRTVRIWDPATSEQTAILQGHQGPVYAVCPVTVGSRQLLATGGDDGTVRIWDPATSEQTAILRGHQDWVRAVCPVTVDDRLFLATASDDRTVRIWDPTTSQQTAILDDHQDWVNAVCPVIVKGRHLLATGSDDRTVRIWDPTTATSLVTIPVHHHALAVAWLGDSLAVGLSAGVLVIELRDVAE